MGSGDFESRERACLRRYDTPRYEAMDCKGPKEVYKRKWVPGLSATSRCSRRGGPAGPDFGLGTASYSRRRGDSDLEVSVSDARSYELVYIVGKDGMMNTTTRLIHNLLQHGVYGSCVLGPQVESLHTKAENSSCPPT